MAITRARLREIIGPEPAITLRSASMSELDDVITEHLLFDLGGEPVRGILTRLSS